MARLPSSKLSLLCLKRSLYQFRRKPCLLERLNNLAFMLFTIGFNGYTQFHSSIAISAYKLVMLSLITLPFCSAMALATRTNMPGLSGNSTLTVKIRPR